MEARPLAGRVPTSVSGSRRLQHALLFGRQTLLPLWMLLDC